MCATRARKGTEPNCTGLSRAGKGIEENRADGRHLGQFTVGRARTAETSCRAVNSMTYWTFTGSGVLATEGEFLRACGAGRQSVLRLPQFSRQGIIRCREVAEECSIVTRQRPATSR